MGLITKILKMFSCKSNCSFNNELFDMELHNCNLSHFELKHKDMQTIHRILTKRKRHKHKHANI